MCVVAAVVKTRCNNCGFVQFLYMTPVGGISRTVDLEGQSFVFDVYFQSVV